MKGKKGESDEDDSEKQGPADKEGEEKDFEGFEGKGDFEDMDFEGVEAKEWIANLKWVEALACRTEILLQIFHNNTPFNKNA